MKKLFISVPMRGRTQDRIQASIEFLRRYAELATGEQFEVINSWFDPNPALTEDANRVYLLGRSIQAMAEADYVVGIRYCDEYWVGCCVEVQVAHQYGKPYLRVDWEHVAVFDDLPGILNRLWTDNQVREVPHV